MKPSGSSVALLVQPRKAIGWCLRLWPRQVAYRRVALRDICLIQALLCRGLLC